MRWKTLALAGLVGVLGFQVDEWGAAPDRLVTVVAPGTPFVEGFTDAAQSRRRFRPLEAHRYWDSWLDGSLVSVAQGLLTVTARASGTPDGMPSVGGVQSVTSFPFGCLTVRARARLGRGLVATLHLSGGDRVAGGRHDEIDVELSSDMPEVVSWDTYHEDDWTNDTRQNAHHRGEFVRTHPLSGLETFDSRQFNTYRIDWRPERVVWRVNGVPIATATDAIAQRPLAIRFDLYHSGRWDTVLGLRPSGTGTLDVDWVRWDRSVSEPPGLAATTRGGH